MPAQEYLLRRKKRHTNCPLSAACMCVNCTYKALQQRHVQSAYTNMSYTCSIVIITYEHTYKHTRRIILNTLSIQKKNKNKILFFEILEPIFCCVLETPNAQLSTTSIYLMAISTPTNFYLYSSNALPHYMEFIDLLLGLHLLLLLRLLL